MHNWWHHWATQIACVLAQVWLRPKADHPGPREEEQIDRPVLDSECLRSVPTSPTDTSPKDKQSPV